jgi:GTP-binding protein
MTGADQDAAAGITPESLEKGRRLFAAECRFITAATTAENLPPSTMPEVAFAGRSNVGKSSLINTLTGRNTLARISQTPGRTRQINFFILNEQMMLVDLPGHGYAEAPKQEIARWTALTDAYFRGRVTLRRLCLLVDSRHGTRKIDCELMDRLDTAAVSYQIILTKTDKTKEGDLSQLKERLGEKMRVHPACHPCITATSAREGTGIPELRAMLAGLCETG